MVHVYSGTTVDALHDEEAKTVAARYGVTVQHVTNLVTAGTIPGLLVGGVWRFNKEEVHKAILVHTSQHLSKKRKLGPAATKPTP